MLLRLAAAAAALFLATAAHAACPPLGVSLKIAPAASMRITPGKRITLRATITNTGASSLSSVGLGLYVPNGLCRIKASTNARVAGNNVYWDGLTLGARKRRKFVLKAQAATNLTAGSTLAVGAAGYVAGNDCGEPAAQGVYTLTVQAAGWANKKASRLSPRAECGVNPVVDPTVPYSLYALNQKCVEGERVTVSDSRRLAGADAEAASVEQEEGDKSRALNGALVITEDECWRACSANGYTNGSYFYVFSPGSGRDDECYCCATCTPVYAQGTSVYQMNAAAPQAELCGAGACATCSAGCRRELSINPGGCQLSMYTPQLHFPQSTKDECIQGAFCVCHCR